MSFFRRHHQNMSSTPQAQQTLAVDEVSQRPPPPINTSTKPVTPSTSSLSASSYIKLVNASANEVVHQRIFILHGSVAENVNSSIVVYHHLNSFPAQRFPIVDGYFKALVHLDPGPNRVCFVCDNNGQRCELDLNYVPQLQNPPVHMAIIVGRDSDGSFDSPDYKKKKEGNGLDVLVKKVRFASYLMAAFTQEQMKRNGFGARTFRLAEGWMPDTLTNRDNNECRQTAIVHIVRSDKTREEIRDPEKAQQNHSGKDTGALFGIALDALRQYEFNGRKIFDCGQDMQVAAIFADTHWDVKRQLILGHAALGGGAGNIRLAIFGSHACHTWPSCMEELVPSFLDETRVDTSQVANDSTQSGTAWEALNVGMGAFMHEIGHLLGCPHEPSGVMLRDYIIWNRSFMITEGYCVRTKGPGKRVCFAADECIWHRLDVLRFRFHPSFRETWEPKIRDAEKPNLYPIHGGVFVRCSSGIYLVEIHADDECRAHIEYVSQPATELFLIEDDLRARLPPQYRDKSIKLEILGRGEKQVGVEDFGKLAREGYGEKGPDGRQVVKSHKLGGDSGDEQMVILDALALRRIECVRVHSGRALDGVEFLGSGSKCLFLYGKRGGDPHDFVLQEDEQVTGFCVRTGAWVDALQVVTNRRRSPMFGNATGGDPHLLVSPEGYTLAGLYGNVGAWVVSIGLVYAQ